MVERISKLKEYICDRKHHVYRQPAIENAEALAMDWKQQGFSNMQRAVRRFTWMTRNEQAVVLPLQKLAFIRTVPDLPLLFTRAEMQVLYNNYSVLELGRVYNVTGDYGRIIKEGLLGRKRAAAARMRVAGSAASREFLEAVGECIDAILVLCGNYAMRADASGFADFSYILRHAVANGATTLREALQIVRVMHFALWCAGHGDNALGRVDQYLLPYYEADRERGVANDDVIELMQEFFLSTQYDADLYPRDRRSQTITLGGKTVSGRSGYNDLTLLCLLAALDLQLPTLSITLRVADNMPGELYDLAASFTEVGMPVPQFASDNVIIPGLAEYGYAVSDARDYAIGASSSIVIPDKSHDITVSGVVSMPKIVLDVVSQDIEKCRNFPMLLNIIVKEIKGRLLQLVKQQRKPFFEPAPVLSILMGDCIEQGRDFVGAAGYANSAICIGGVGAAADALAAIRQTVYLDQRISWKELLRALENNFIGFESIRQLLLNAPKTGNDDDFADDMLKFILQSFSDGIRGLLNERGGVFRPGFDMANLALTAPLGATADGRFKNEPIDMHYTPNTAAMRAGIRAAAVSFAKPELTGMALGGPFVLPVPPIMRADEIAQLVKLFFSLGGHQIAVAVDEMVYIG
ncbi:MAG: pyruvate formate lyase family protein [Clostridiales bacterium]|jgi:formate C-acetyltransferase|nr:pyruvate formate lyase family protein [Clostridiales bacterium]